MSMSILPLPINYFPMTLTFTKSGKLNLQDADADFSLHLVKKEQIMLSKKVVHLKNKPLRLKGVSLR